MTPQVEICPDCSAPLPSEAPGGLCSACAVRLVLNVDLTDAAPGDAEDDTRLDSHSRHTGLGQFGDYEILEKIGHGGMGVVYKVRQRSVSRIVALKMIRSGLWASESDVSRFRLEREAAARLQHPYIATIYEAGECEDQLYFTMEYFGGGDLEARFGEGQSCEPLKAAQILEQIARGVHHAHQRAVLHRDLKPANVMLDEKGRPKVADFGLARLTDTQTSLTMTHSVLGSPNYIAPELADNAKGAASVQSDVYGLGAILYYLLTTKPPFEASSSVQTIRRVVDEEVTAPRILNRQVPTDLETICLRCLEKDPGNRYMSARDVADELDRFLAGEPILARPIGFLERGRRWCRRNPALSGSLAGLMLALLLGVAGIAWQWQRAVRSEQSALVEARAARREAYLSNMLLAHEEQKRANMGHFKQMLLDEIPAPGQKDLRGFEWPYLYSLCHRDTRTMTSRLMVVTEAIPSPDGKILAVLGHRGYRSDDKWSDQPVDRMIEFWDPRNGAPLAPIVSEDSAAFACLDFSPDGQFLATGSWEGVDLWEVSTRKRVSHSHMAHADWVLAVAFSPDGNHLASGGFDQSVTIWDIKGDTPTPLRRFDVAAETGRILNLSFSPDGTIVAAAGQDGFLACWDSHSGRPLPRPQRGTDSFVKKVVFHPDPASSLMASAGGDKFISLWNYRTGELLEKMHGHLNDIYGLAFSPDGQHLVSGSWDNSVRLWNTTTGEESAKWAHDSYGRSANFLPDGRHVASASRDRKIKIWDLEKADLARTIQPLQSGRVGDSGTRDSIDRLGFSSDGSRLCTVRLTRVEVWDLDSGQCVFSQSNGLHLLDALAPDLRRLAVGKTQDAGIQLLLVDGRHDADPLPVDKETPPCQDWSVDGRFFAQAHPVSGVRLFRGDTGALLRVFDPCSDRVTELQFSGDGDRLVGSTSDATVVIWDRQSGRLQSSFEVPPGTKIPSGYPSFVRSLDAKHLWMRGSTATAQLWNLEHGRTILEGHRYMIASPDGGLIATSLPEKQGWRIYQTTSLYKPKLELRPPDGGHFFSLSFSPDGERIATGRHGYLDLWDSETGRVVLTLGGFDSDVQSLAFSPGGRKLAVGAGNGAIHIFELPDEGTIERWLTEDLQEIEETRFRLTFSQ